jgi:hypothetical protein
VLPTNARRVRNPGADIHHQFKRETGFRADLVALPIDVNFCRCPGVLAVRISVDFSHADRRVMRGVLGLDRPIEHHADVLNQLVGRAGRRSPLVPAALKILFSERGIGQFAGRLAETIQDAALVWLGCEWS